MPVYRVHYLRKGRAPQLISADDYADEGDSIIFRRRLADGSLEDLRKLGTSSVDHVETVDDRRVAQPLILISAADLSKLERGETVEAAGILIAVDHSRYWTGG
jgi:hypothetical protein